ncbi:uncharacterized protein HMPREF1541_05340 [Cyphellophora europaea CBS 101466]|uniref:Uncharacterized protein n=1 Tax=Cyphellophora europaea (strain CBS 101466) TaxID=1220924 RepID=W2RTP2_CYPE1|nr:uncharacterized protein HMPREF1541_05340 [Cyphellophora europaea CBS 101466]ETN39118.1 hypothetical protein HMPREF1541_05340 [Cyphellophora europaea CBS 101466]
MSIASNDAGQEVLVRPPAHPVPTLQGPFEESMVESVSDAADYDVPIDAVSRRTMLLEAPTYERIIAGRWKQKPGEKYHPLWKLIAQMTFGLHLLARNLAKSEDEVMKILQAHVDDIDSFLERTSEDFDLAQSDMRERLRCLKLPLQHTEIFDRMLEDRNFRASILEGNEKIEHIVSRTKKALKDSMKDVQKGFDAANVLDTYINGLSRTWHRDSPEHEAVHVAMVGNVEGWKGAFMDLHLQGNKVAGVLKKLTEIVNEMEKRAAAVSRSQLVKSQASMATIGQASAGSRGSAHKPLPMAPDHRRSTRHSSRSSTNILRDISSPYSGRGSSQDESSGESPRYGSPQPPSGRQTPNTTLSSVLHAAQESAIDSNPSQSLEEATKMKVDAPAIELPADVPEDALRQAPMSVKNRLSYTLGLKPRDNIDHRISSIYYPRALGDLLKVQQSPPVMNTPQLSAVKSDSPHSSSDYFSAHIRGSSITVVPVDGSGGTTSNLATPDRDVPRIAVRTPSMPVEVQRVVSEQVTVTSSPGLNFHPSVMDMATPPPPPVELPVENEHQEQKPLLDHHRQQSQSSVGLLSSLGEPGPEVTSSEFGGESATEPPLPSSHLSAAGAGKAPRVMSGMDLPETVMDSLAATSSSPPSPRPEAIALPVSPPPLGSTPGTPGVDQPMSAVIEQGQDNSTPRVQTPVADAQPSFSQQNNGDEAEHQQHQDPTPTSRAFIAELEAHVPYDSRTSTPKQSATFPDSPIEMEAPAAQFILPSRASAKEIKINAPPTVKQRKKAFPHSAQDVVSKGMKPKDFNRNSIVPEPIRPLKLKLERKGGKMVPVQVPSPNSESVDHPKTRSPRLSTDVISSILDTMSDTPATSPSTEPSQSDVSSPAIARDQQRSSTQFGPPGSAPAPPGPGGRSMVNPDYASAGAFEGERKQGSKPTKRHSAGGRTASINGIKELISGASSRRHSTESVKTRGPSISSQRVGSDMIDSTGKDVLWFKNQSKANKAGAPQAVGVTSV